MAMTQLSSDLLVKGAKCYVDALTAIEAFRREVEKICQGAYDRHEKRLLEAMGITNEECERFDNTDDLENREVELGVRRSAQPGQLFYIYLWWSEGEGGSPTISAAVCLDLNTKNLRVEILDKIRRKNPDCRIREDLGVSYNLLLQTPVAVSDPASVSETLDSLISDWVRYCESIGGLKLKERRSR